MTPDPESAVAETRRAAMLARAALIISCVALAVAILALFLPL